MKRPTVAGITAGKGNKLRPSLLSSLSSGMACITGGLTFSDKSEVAISLRDYLNSLSTKPAAGQTAAIDFSAPRGGCVVAK